MPYFTVKGLIYNRNKYGCYPVNNGDPQCDDPDAPDIEELKYDPDKNIHLELNS